MKLSRGQILEDFYGQIVEKAQILKKKDHEILSQFIKGLPEQLAFFVRAGTHKDSVSALAAAKMGEAYGYRKNDEAPGHYRANCNWNGHGEISPTMQSVNFVSNSVMVLFSVTIIVIRGNQSNPGVIGHAPSGRSSIGARKRSPPQSRQREEINYVNYSTDTEDCEFTDENLTSFKSQFYSYAHQGEETESKFLSNFELPKHLSTDEQRQISQFLIQYKDLFVTDENPRLGYTELVKHNICLKPDFKPKHQQPYRLSPDKKNVLRDHLDELLKQGIISPVQEPKIYRLLVR
ncbi:Hypothetical predicted protein [Mytilus galloprovincialis]|uniref:Reverse transcriptase/retrotransposon-derived protein RNase H-like domain-containing protein n=1 Tax=Mytilus galloprovincialis TaxID=29158 RepID=A0A8B6C4E2_MYTGA|nr:Hypothetical predicted protein [Mytilus galloprovincialis]